MPKDYSKFKVDDGSPTDPLERKEYCGRISGFFSDIMKSKLESMIALQMQELTNLENSKEKDLFIKANINALSLLLDWGDDALREFMEKPEIN